MLDSYKISFLGIIYFSLKAFSTKSKQPKSLRISIKNFNLMAQTYLIKRSQIEKVLDMKDCVSIVENAFRLYGDGKVQMPPKVYLSFERGDVRCMPVYIPSMNIAGVKNVNVHPKNKNLPSVMATITLFDPETGFPLAVMDGTYITNMRTGAAGGIAAKYLSIKNPKVATFIGAGVQAETQLEALLITKPTIFKIKVYDADSDKAENFAKNYRKKYENLMNVLKTNSIEGALQNTNIIITTTPVKKPIIKAEYINCGVHINAIGADAKGKQELDSEILKKSRIIIDDWEQASHSGEINVPLSKGVISKKDIYGNIGEIVSGKKPGRESDDQITIFDSTGLAIQDISVAYEVYKKLTSNEETEKDIERVNFFK